MLCVSREWILKSKFPSSCVEMYMLTSLQNDPLHERSGILQAGRSDIPS